jgi:ABC-type glutathione transport system ATPase component
MTGTPLLAASDLAKTYAPRGPGARGRSPIAAVDGVSFELAVGEALAVVGPSGCGKSTLVRLLLVLEDPDRGEVRFQGQTISHLAEYRLRPLRRGFQAVFQDPGSSLDPSLDVATIVAEPMEAHRIGSRADRRHRVRDLLMQVGLPPESARARPRQLSGGERQRVAIARALAVSPRLLILDEPVTAVDRPVQGQIMELIGDLRRRLDLSIVLVSHDLQVVRRVCERMAVMHDGRFVEEGSTEDLVRQPRHECTRSLLAAARLDG